MWGKTTAGTAVVLAAMITLGCGEDKPEPPVQPADNGQAAAPTTQPTTLDDVKRETDEAIEAAGKLAAEQKQLALDAAKSKLAALKARWGDLKTQAGDVTQSEWQAMSESVGKQVDAMEQRITELKVADVTVDDVKAATADGLGALSDQLDKAADWLRKPKTPEVTVPPAGAAPATQPDTDEPEK